MWALSDFGDVTIEAWPGAPGQGDAVSPAGRRRLGLFAGAAIVRSRFGAEIGSRARLHGREPGCGGDLTVDDITFGPVASPDTEILSGPTPMTRSTDASFLFVGNQPETGFECRLDNATRRALPAAVRADGPRRRRAHARGQDARPLRLARRHTRGLELDRRPQPGRHALAARARR